MSQAFVNFVYWIEDNNGRFPSHDAKNEDEKRKYRFWKTSKQVKEVEREYINIKSLEEVPKCYRKYISFYFGYLRDKSVFKKLIDWLKENNGEIPHSHNRTVMKKGMSALTNKEKEERALYSKWIYSDDKKMLDEYLGVDINEVPLVYREYIDILRGYGIGVPEKSVYQEYISWLEKYGVEPRSAITDRNGRMTEEEKEMEISLRKAWDASEEKKIYVKYMNLPLEQIPSEYREMVMSLKEYNVGKVKKDVYDEIIAFLNKNGTLPRTEIRVFGEEKAKSRYDYTKSERMEVNLRNRWNTSDIKDALEFYVGVEETEIPEEYRDKIMVLRSYGLGLPKLKVIDTYEEYIAWIKEYGKKPRTAINKGGNKFKVRAEMTDLEAYEISLAQKFHRSKIRDVLNEYYGKPIDSVPPEYRADIAELRSLGVVGKSKDALLQRRMRASVTRCVNSNREVREELGIDKDSVKEEVEN